MRGLRGLRVTRNLHLFTRKTRNLRLTRKTYNLRLFTRKTRNLPSTLGAKILINNYLKIETYKAQVDQIN